MVSKKKKGSRRALSSVDDHIRRQGKPKFDYLKYFLVAFFFSVVVLFCVKFSDSLKKLFIKIPVLGQIFKDGKA